MKEIDLYVGNDNEKPLVWVVPAGTTVPMKDDNVPDCEHLNDASLLEHTDVSELSRLMATGQYRVVFEHEFNLM